MMRERQAQEEKMLYARDDLANKRSLAQWNMEQKTKEFDAQKNTVLALQDSLKEMNFTADMQRSVSEKEKTGAGEEITKGKLKDALTKKSNKNFDEDVTKSLVADFLTNRQRQMFYGEETVEVGGKQVPKYQTLVPEKGNINAQVRLGRKSSRGWAKFHDKNEGSLFISGVEITSPEQYVEAGGNWGYLQEQGYIYDKDKQVFKYVEPVKHAGPTGGGKYNIKKE